MDNHSDFTKYDRAIIALIQYRNISKAARALGVHPTTLWRWLKDPEFQKRLRQAQYQVHSSGIAKLRDLEGLAGHPGFDSPEPASCTDPSREGGGVCFAAFRAGTCVGRPEARRFFAQH